MEINRRGRHRSERDSWRSLQLFLIYRLGVSGVILALRHFDMIPGIPPRLDSLFYTIALTLFGIDLLSLPFTFRRWLPFRVQVIGMMVIDVLALTLLMHLSNGLDSGLGLLILPSIAGASLLLPGHLAPAFAALGTLVVFGEIGLGFLTGRYSTSALTLGGIQGTLFFAVSILAARLARRAQASETLARKRGQDLAQLSRLNSFIVEQMDQGVLLVNARGRIQSLNEAARKILRKPELVAGKMLASASMELKNVWDQWRASGTPPELRDAASNDGAEFEIRIIQADDGDSALIFLHSISERSRRVQEIKLAALGRLTASIAHEIRNPLGAISHAGQLLSESRALDSADQRLVQIVINNCQRMNRTVENVLSLSRRESAHPKSLPIRDWIGEIVEEFRERFQLGNDQLRLTLPTEPVKCHADPEQLHQVIWNLLRNARSHADPDGELSISISGGYSRDERVAWLDVADNGQGIASDVENQLFEPFFTTDAGNTGLGLYLARELCENNGGSLEYIREDQGGARFRIKLPLAA